MDNQFLLSQAVRSQRARVRPSGICVKDFWGQYQGPPVPLPYPTLLELDSSPDTGSSQCSESKSGNRGCSVGHRRSPGDRKTPVRCRPATRRSHGDREGHGPETVSTRVWPSTVLAFSRPDAYATQQVTVLKSKGPD